MNTFIVLLRGINVSGKNKIGMKELKTELEKLGFDSVRTLLNSGNIILHSNDSKEEITSKINEMILTSFHLSIPVYTMTDIELEDILNHAPSWWANENKMIYDNLIFLFPPLTFKDVDKEIGDIKQGVEQIYNYKNVIYWSFLLKEYSKTSYIHTASSSINDQVTIRTANTMNKIMTLCKK